MRENVLKKRITTSALLILLIFLMFNSLHIMTASLLIMGTLSAIEFLNLTNRIIKNKLSFFFLNSIFIFYVSIFSISFFILYNFQQSKFILLILLIGCISSDIGGYLFGKILKGPKLTKISPNKTIAGALGSFVLTCTVMSGIIYYKINIFNFSILFTGLLTSFFCQLGDLFFSYLKRKAKLKDTGNLLPGHGGILDRLDGVFFGIPFGFATLILFF